MKAITIVDMQGLQGTMTMRNKAIIGEMGGPQGANITGGMRLPQATMVIMKHPKAVVSYLKHVKAMALVWSHLKAMALVWRHLKAMVPELK